MFKKRLFTPSNVKDRSVKLKIEEKQEEKSEAASIGQAAAAAATPAPEPLPPVKPNETTPINQNASTINDNNIPKHNYKAIIFNLVVFVFIILMLTFVIFIIYNYVKIARSLGHDMMSSKTTASTILTTLTSTTSRN